MIIKRIELKGAGRPAVSLGFSKGLNVVAGASNTGKSYVIQCIQFILGSSRLPKAIKESRGYEYVVVTFEENDGSQFFLQRKLEINAAIVLGECGTDKITVLKGKHKKGLANISNSFLSRFGLNDKFLLKSKQNLTTQALTLRMLEKVFVIDEARIVAEYSPLGTGQRSEKTLESSLLSTLLTGLDDVKAKKLRVDAGSKNTLERKIQAAQDLIGKLYPAAKTQEHEIEEIDKGLSRLIESLQRFDSELMDAVSLSEVLIDKRADILCQISAINAQRLDDRLLIERFQLLKSKYVSDQERLLGIGEAADALENYTRVACSVCGQALTDSVSDEEVIDIAISAGAEARKIDAQLKDLNKAIVDLEKSLDQSKESIERLQEELNQVNEEINGRIKEKVVEANEAKARIYAKQSEYLSIKLQLESRNRALAELGALRMQADTNQVAYEANSFEEELGGFVENVGAILQRWGYPDFKPTTFSNQDRDLVIGGTPRSHFGKGYRAIAFSAFVVGLMDVLSRAGRHPGFVVLDSPLTTYKQADKDRGEEDESIAADMIYAFYRDLCESYKNQQIIVFDNQEPDSDLHPLMNYVHFSKNKNLGRYGFFNPLENA